jgi:hypothetical protein
MAGGGVKPGVSFGATDEFGFNVATDGVRVHDFQATVVRLLVCRPTSGSRTNSKAATSASPTCMAMS